ncbi:hypothetical protein GH714_000526 [Hevea brasiliensis]|uniref:Pentacotripeptide-repeat region of PRORP domain-containing protein n=1 Tax=Hevea brasiliensis TaxID=3981 RepID=A0A6A6L835_HEVBR|nr:hypothetical protein GH714_000526 [Hevea brasiliensis]
MPARNVVTWNAMIGGYVRNGDMKSASVLFEKMSSRTAVTWIEMIDGFARSGDLVTARCIFDQVPPQLKDVVTWTVMVDGYTSKGQMAVVRVLFEEMPERNFFAWSSMISGYCKIGHVKEARAIFDLVPIRNLVNWNSLICGYAQNRFCEEALKAFRKMQADGFEPDEVTVVSILSAIAQLGLLDVGKYVRQLVYDKGIKLNQFVMNALVDMYAKCDMYAKFWGALVGACRVHFDMDMVKRVMEDVNRQDRGVDSGNNPHYVLLSNIYVASDCWGKAERMRMLMVNQGLLKTPGRSSVMLVNAEE